MISPQKIPKRPTQKEYAAHYLLTAIMDGTFSPGESLPNERTLSETIGVTRPTLRETLHQLAGEGWVTIRHGKPTMVNDYWKTGHLGMLNTMAAYGEYLPEGFIGHLLDMRSILLPEAAAAAAAYAPDVLMGYLGQADLLEDTADAYVDFDWGLHGIFARESRNPLSIMIFNSFEHLYLKVGYFYFDHKDTRASSRKFYGDLLAAVQARPDAVGRIVRDEMKRAKLLWDAIEAERNNCAG